MADDLRPDTPRNRGALKDERVNATRPGATGTAGTTTGTVTRKPV